MNLTKASGKCFQGIIGADSATCACRDILTDTFLYESGKTDLATAAYERATGRSSIRL